MSGKKGWLRAGTGAWCQIRYVHSKQASTGRHTHTRTQLSEALVRLPCLTLPATAMFAAGGTHVTV